jgi:hypothetical protein
VKAFALVLVCLIPLSALAVEQDDILRKASELITQHGLLSSEELSCSILELDELTDMVATVTVRETYGRKCPFDPDAGPRWFTMEIDLRTGAAQWDNNDEVEMRPVPHR